MKRATSKPQPSQTDSDDINCSCELLDTSLSQVGDSDCSCSDCLQANLMAFNELRLEEEMQIASQSSSNNRGSTRRNNNMTNTTQNMRARSKQHDERDTQPTRVELSQFQSVDRMRKTRPKTSGKKHTVEEEGQENMEAARSNFSKQCVSDYVRITRHRARQYMDELHALQKGEEEQRSKLKEHIKENLLNLKLVTKSQFYPEKPRPEGEVEEGDKILHLHKWNHTPLVCNKRRPQYIPQPFDDPNRHQNNLRVMEAKQRLRKYKLRQKDEEYECPDRCPNHHMRTSKEAIAKMEKFIEKKAKEYKKKKAAQKAEKEKQSKVKDAKLRAIDLKCKQIVAKSKKYDPNISRTSFHNSIDHFSTFSELGRVKKERDREREIKYKKKANPQHQADLEAAIYENIEGQLMGQHPPIHSNIQGQRQPQSEDSPLRNEEWCQKIVRDARIRPPKHPKEEDKPAKAAKEKKKAEQREKERMLGKPTQKQSSKAALQREEVRRRELQAEIERRKEQIVGEFKKRSNEVDPKKSKNQALRQQYEKALPKKKAY